MNRRTHYFMFGSAVFLHGLEAGGSPLWKEPQLLPREAFTHLVNNCLWILIFTFQIKWTALEISQRSPDWERGGCWLLITQADHQIVRGGESGREREGVGLPRSDSASLSYQLLQLLWQQHKVPSRLSAMKQPSIWLTDAWQNTSTRGFPGGSLVKNLPADAGDAGNEGLIPGSGRSPGGGHGNPLQYPCLENPTDRGDWRATVHGVAKSRTRLKWLIMDILFRVLSHTGYHRLLSRSLCYTVGPCWLSVFHVVACVCSSHAPDLSLSMFPFDNHDFISHNCKTEKYGMLHEFSWRLVQEPCYSCLYSSNFSICAEAST